MKYLLLIYQNPEEWNALTEEERTCIGNDAGTIANELSTSGELVDGEGLAHPSASKSIRVRDGEVTVTDGPYIESKEQMAGYLIVEAESPERAVEIAARWPDARYWGMEVRPLMHHSGEDV
jgi:hypothetical protein